jgi:hypothetical protein
MPVVMMTETPMETPSKRPRVRATKAEVEARRDALFAMVEEGQPMTVRQVFYQATVRGLVEKSEYGYGKIQQDLTKMRKAGRLPYDWLVDYTRRQILPVTYDGVEHALRDTAESYRKDLWADANCRVEIWIEKDALAGVVEAITMKYAVPLMVARGYSSLSFLHRASEISNGLGLPTYVYHFGDHDPSGVNAGEKIEEWRKDATDGTLHFERVAVTQQQISDWNLPSRPNKESDTRTLKFEQRFGTTQSVELDAIEPRRLRDLVEGVIQRHLPSAAYEQLQAAEKNERQLIKRLQLVLSELGNHLAG